MGQQRFRKRLSSGTREMNFHLEGTVRKSQHVMKISPVKPDRSRIALTSDALIRHWTKELDARKEEIIAAIEKVGDNPDTVRKELAAMNPENRSS